MINMNKCLLLLIILQNLIQWSHGFKTFPLTMPSVRPYRVSKSNLECKKSIQKGKVHVLNIWNEFPHNDVIGS